MEIFRMPSLGADMEAGVLVEWLVSPGDTVKRGDIIAVVETQKGAIEIEIFVTGTVEQLVAAIGDKLPVGEPMAKIRPGNDREISKEKSAPRPAPQTPKPIAPPLKTADPPPVRSNLESTSVRASPAARRLASAKGVDLSTIQDGSGPKGAIRLSDVERSLKSLSTKSSASAKPHPADTAPMRMAIASAMARSKRDIPHYYLSHDIDLQAAGDWLKQININRTPGNRLLMGMLLLRASALAACKSPDMNGFWIDDAFQPSRQVHAGIVVSLRGGGLVAPALHDADRLDIDTLQQKAGEIVQRARTGRLRSSEVSDPTITITSLGDRGIDTLFGIIFPPQVAIVGFGTPRLRPAIVEGAVQARLMVTATLAADHRVSDGRSGARFLSEIAKFLQMPEAL